MLVAAFAACLGAGRARAHEGHATGPHPTATPTAARQAEAPKPPVRAEYRILPEARADLGWTGISHDQPWPAEQRLAFALDCKPGEARCAALGGTRGDFFGAPIPLSSGGVPACVVNRLRTGVAGSVDPQTGCGDLQIHLASAVFTGDEVARPCPVCRGDATPNDGKRDGRCQGGGTDGAACDAHAASALFGATSNDCVPPAGKSAGELTIDLAPLTTDEAALEASLTCKAASGTDAARCFCPAQVQANACIGERCAASSHCAEGPIDGACSAAPYRGCRPGSGRADCDDVAPGSGECRTLERPCFGERIAARGHCDPERPTYVAVFCAPQTRAQALNVSAGLPGPARIVLPLERVR
jgi:hypothetical protein